MNDNQTEPKPCAGSPTGSGALRSGWWWTRPAADCLWRVVEITIGDDGKVWIQEMGDESPDILLDMPWWEWSGPIVPPNNCGVALDRYKTERLRWKNLALKLTSEACEVLNNSHQEVSYSAGDLRRTIAAVKAAQLADILNPDILYDQTTFTRGGTDLTQSEIEFLLWCVGFAQGKWDKEREAGHLRYNPKFDALRNRLMDMKPADESKRPNSDMSGPSDGSAPRTGSVVPNK